MAKYVAFLRGVNVGGRIIKMSDLKTAFEKAGFKDVKPFLQSGNILFESDSSANLLKTQIEELLSTAYNYSAKAQVIPLANLAKIIDANPFENAAPDYHQYVIFIENGLETSLVAEAGEQSGEDIKAGRGVVYWKVKKGQTLSNSFGKLLTKSKYKDLNTTRNINTLQRIIAS